MNTEPTSTRADPAWQAEITRLHREAAQDTRHWQEQRAEDERLHRDNDALVRMGRIYLAVSAREGQLLYDLVRTAGARYLVEFGASYGVSTLYLGAAARDCGGHLYTTEVHPDKCRALGETLNRAGLNSHVTLLEGDARITLAGLPAGIDCLFLDGWKGQYLPVLELLIPALAPGALVAADNVHHPAARDFRDRITGDRRWETRFEGELAISCYRP